jgi:hypothetical protein
MPPNGKSDRSEASVLREAKDAASHLMTEAKEEVQNRAYSQKERAAESLSGVAHALRGTKQELDEKAPGFGMVADKAADAVERVSDLIRNRDIADVVQGVERFARREPALFIGGAIALGLVAGRFLRSSPHSEYASGEFSSEYGRERQFGAGSEGDREGNYGSGNYGSTDYSSGSGYGLKPQNKTDPYGYGLEDRIKASEDAAYEESDLDTERDGEGSGEV